MVKTIPTIADSASPALSTKARNPFKLIEKNYQNNLASDYTEKIEQLDKAFDYANNSTHYWSEPELSLLYGTPLYEAASPAQKLALNHLYWVSQYNFTALGEAETVHYNQITAGSLSRMGGSYEAIAHQLEHEATQERSHIHAFFFMDEEPSLNLCCVSLLLIGEVRPF